LRTVTVRAALRIDRKSRGMALDHVMSTKPNSSIIAFLISVFLALPDAVIGNASTKRMWRGIF
jgi:hypothetical protein